MQEDLGGFSKPACPNDISFFGCGSGKDATSCKSRSFREGKVVLSGELLTRTGSKRGPSGELDAMLCSETLCTSLGQVFL